MEELKAHPVVAQLDALAAYYQAIYGNTAEIQTEERDEIRDQILDWFLSLGSARTESVNEQGKHSYTYDGPLARNYQAEIVIGLPASGKSTRIADPDSEAMQAFILDPDVIKGALPEYVESHGAAADAVHKEGSMMLTEAMQEFLDGEMKGINVIIPTIGDSLEKLLERYVYPFEKAGYNVKVRICRAKENEAAARVVKRELSGGQLINSTVAFNFGDGPDNVYEKISTMINSKGETYGYEEDLQPEEEEEQPAA